MPPHPALDSRQAAAAAMADQGVQRPAFLHLACDFLRTGSTPPSLPPRRPRWIWRDPDEDHLQRRSIPSTVGFGPCIERHLRVDHALDLAAQLLARYSNRRAKPRSLACVPGRAPRPAQPLRCIEPARWALWFTRAGGLLGQVQVLRSDRYAHSDRWTLWFYSNRYKSFARLANAPTRTNPSLGRLICSLG